ncbi:transmembrane protein 241 isoform X1 [Cololabis saira]|uniref:transmembrane protein 241 isoform X1 n=1 Tax=Cololabis saira TaxID=129043 RepID=UPI002AD4C43C|nr:transmembrane protein 241 isoform X1 [Cololabis saira]
MQWRRHVIGLAFSFVFVVSYFTNKFVLSVLNFTYPTLFQGWQTFIGAVLLLMSGKLGWVEMSRVSRSAALSWLPGSLLFVGNIYAGSRALSRIDIPFFFTLQNSSHVVSFCIIKVLQREKTHWLKFISLCLMLLSAFNLPLFDPQLDYSGYLWAACHLFCVGAYRVFQVHSKSNNLSDYEQQCINYLFSQRNMQGKGSYSCVNPTKILSDVLLCSVSTTDSSSCLHISVLLLALAAHPTGDLTGALEFPSLQSRTFHCGCCASALLGFFMLLASVRLKRGISLHHFRVWIFLSKVTAMSLSPFIFYMNINISSCLCVVTSHAGEALLLYSDSDTQPS